MNNDLLHWESSSELVPYFTASMHGSPETTVFIYDAKEGSMHGAFIPDNDERVRRYDDLKAAQCAADAYVRCWLFKNRIFVNLVYAEHDWILEPRAAVIDCAVGASPLPEGVR